jgi:hypothetical protein
MPIVTLLIGPEEQDIQLILWRTGKIARISVTGQAGTIHKLRGGAHATALDSARHLNPNHAFLKSDWRIVYARNMLTPQIHHQSTQYPTVVSK